MRSEKHRGRPKSILENHEHFYRPPTTRSNFCLSKNKRVLPQMLARAKFYATCRLPDARNEVVTSQLADFLCWHLQAEYSQQNPRIDSTAPEISSPVTDWLDEARSQHWQNWSSSTDYWATRTLASHVKAIIYWHMDFNSAVRIVERYNDHMHIGRAKAYLHDALTTSYFVTDPLNRSLKISEDSFNCYSKIINSEGRRAVAMLHHPTAPDALPLYRLHQAAPRTIPGKLGKYHARPAQYARASELLREQGMENEANDMYQARAFISGRMVN
ncbi:hypothetical protein CBER1_07659 [Cercospora berteroae]|uniref:Uncharacterized protein n=1 Tax=Cercospora berteroae TaxID=357750 RepID=A0A2S6C4H9_9PEZI|nr:hypothetical protein CBER1_07659 [Cercospora berteroae]